MIPFFPAFTCKPFFCEEWHTVKLMFVLFVVLWCRTMKIERFCLIVRNRRTFRFILSLVHSVDGIDRWWKYFEFQMTKYIWLGTYKTKEFISQLWCGIYTYLTTKKHITFVNGMVELSADSEFVECFYHHFHFLALSKRRTNFHPIFSGYMRTIFNLHRLLSCSRISYLLNHKTCDSRQSVSGNVR